MVSHLRCKCTIHGCGDSGPEGRLLASKIVKRHELDERSSSVRTLYAEARSLADDAVASQIEDITAHLAASTLSDQVSGSSTSPGGRLWGKPSPENVSSTRQTSSLDSTIPHRPRRSFNRDPEKEALSHLNHLGAAVEVFSGRVSMAIQSLDEPSITMKSMVFPLDTYQETLATFYDQLDHITLQKPVVLERKRSILEQLTKLQECLSSARSSWLSKLEEVNKTIRNAPGIPFHTGS